MVVGGWVGVVTCPPCLRLCLPARAEPTAPHPPARPITGEELRQLVLDKWDCSYDVSLQRRGTRVYL